MKKLHFSFCQYRMYFCLYLIIYKGRSFPLPSLCERNRLFSFIRQSTGFLFRRFFVVLFRNGNLWLVMLQKTKGIVLHTLKYNDTSIIVDIYTELSGRASFLVAVPRSRKATVKSVLFQPLSFIEFEADYRPNATLYRVKEAKSFYPFSSIPYDPYKSAMALFLSEFLYRAIREEACLLYTSPSPRDHG